MISRPALPMLAAFALAACTPSPPPPAGPITVRTVVAGAAETSSSRSYSGDVHARYELPIGFRIGGKLLERKADLGAHVVAGQILARLDPADVAFQADQAHAQLVFADADAKRYRDLQTKNFVSPAALDAKETALKSAQAQAGLATNQRAYAALTADRGGVVAAVLAEPGQVLSSGQPVYRLALDGEREVQISLPEQERAAVRIGDPASVTLWAGDRAYHGRVRELAPAADPATRTYAAKIAIVDPDERAALGMTANVRFERPATQALTLPLTSIFQQGDRAAVWVVAADQTIKLTPVTIASYSDAGAVISEGLRGGERIVALGVHKLTAGEKVRLGQ